MIARFYLSYDTKIAFYKQICTEKVTILALQNATFLWISATERYDVICILNPVVDYRFKCMASLHSQTQRHMIISINTYSYSAFQTSVQFTQIYQKMILSLKGRETTSLTSTEKWKQKTGTHGLNSQIFFVSLTLKQNLLYAYTRTCISRVILNYREDRTLAFLEEEYIRGKQKIRLDLLSTSLFKMLNVANHSAKIKSCETHVNSLLQMLCFLHNNLKNKQQKKSNKIVHWPLDQFVFLVTIQLKEIATNFTHEPRHDKTNKVSVRPAKTQISLGIRPVWSESSLRAQWVAKDPSFLHANSEDSDQTGQMPRLIWVFAGRTLTLLVLSCCGSCVKFVAISFLLNRYKKNKLMPRLIWVFTGHTVTVGFVMSRLTSVFQQQLGEVQPSLQRPVATLSRR